VKYPAPTVVALVPKHGLADCVVASLACYLGKPYEEVVAAAGKVYPNFWKCGLKNIQTTKIARRLGCRVKWVRDYDIEDDSGVLGLNYHTGSNEHAVVLIDGRIYELEGRQPTAWEPDAYLAAHGARPGLLLVREDA
jgi:hypothetical protein